MCAHIIINIVSSRIVTYLWENFSIFHSELFNVLLIYIFFLKIVNGLNDVYNKVANFNI